MRYGAIGYGEFGEIRFGKYDAMRYGKDDVKRLDSTRLLRCDTVRTYTVPYFLCRTVQTVFSSTVSTKGKGFYALPTYLTTFCMPYRNILTVPYSTESTCRIAPYRLSYCIASYASYHIVQYTTATTVPYPTLLTVSKRTLPYRIVHANTHRAVR